MIWLAVESLSTAKAWQRDYDETEGTKVKLHVFRLLDSSHI